MRHRKKKATLDRLSAPRASLLRSLVTSVIEHGKITTSHAKAKAAQPLLERCITRALNPTIHNRRSIASFVFGEAATKRMISEVAPKMQRRQGGYTRIVKL